MATQKRMICIPVILSIIMTALPTAHLYAQAPATDDGAFHLFLPQVSHLNDPSLTADDLEMLFAPEEDIAWDVHDVQAAATALEIAPQSYKTLRGNDGGQPVGALAQCDSPNTSLAQDWEKYLELYTPGSTRYVGYRTYILPDGVTPAAIRGLQVKANYMGPARADQRWIWRIFDWQQRKWILLGDNQSATSWQWSNLSFTAGGTLANYVHPSNRQIRVRVQSTNASDDMDLDCETLAVTTDAAPPPPPPGDWWKPTPGTSWQIQLLGAIDTSFNVQVYFIDLFDAPQAKIDQLHQQGRKVVCYFSAGSYENWRPDAGDFPNTVLGKQLDGWEGEQWLDVRNLNALGPIMAARMDLAVSKGCDGVDPDNVDGYTNNTGFPLSGNHQLTYNRWLAQEAHTRGLAIGLKNDLNQIEQLVNDFDWALNEQCFQYNECKLLLPFVQAGKPVFGIEYSGQPSSFCPQANNWNFDFLKKRLNLKAWRYACR